MSPDYFEDLLLYKGQTIITTDGTTLLGADDKAGITEIVTAMEYLIQHPEIKHGKIRIGFENSMLPFSKSVKIKFVEDSY